MNWQQHITSDPEIFSGNPIIKGARIPVDLLLEKLAAGVSKQLIFEAHPELTSDDIQACLLFAVERVRQGKYSLPMLR